MRTETVESILVDEWFIGEKIKFRYFSVPAENARNKKSIFRYYSTLTQHIYISSANSKKKVCTLPLAHHFYKSGCIAALHVPLLPHFRFRIRIKHCNEMLCSCVWKPLTKWLEASSRAYKMRPVCQINVFDIFHGGFLMAWDVYLNASMGMRVRISIKKIICCRSCDIVYACFLQILFFATSFGLVVVANIKQKGTLQMFYISSLHHWTAIWCEAERYERQRWFR